MADIVLQFPAPAPLLSMNTKQDRTSRKHHQAWRDAAYYRYIEAHPGVGPKGRALGPCVAHISLPIESARRRDPANFQATVKPIIDGIQRAGAWPDDTPDWVDQRNPSFHKGTDVIIRLEER